MSLNYNQIYNLDLHILTSYWLNTGIYWPNALVLPEGFSQDDDGNDGNNADDDDWTCHVTDM